MSNWSDLLGDDPEPKVDFTPSPEAIQQLAEALDVTPEMVNQHTPEVWKLGGTEPPDHVVRLKLVDDDSVELARVPRDADGQSRGWWWVGAGEIPDTEKGWNWNAHQRRTGWDLVQVSPTIKDANGPFAVSLVQALPFDAAWYHVGMRPDGMPVWGWIESPDDWDVMSHSHDPTEDE